MALAGTVARNAKAQEKPYKLSGEKGMLVAQLISTHSAAMECFRKATHPNCSIEVQQKSLGYANKLVRSYAALVESLERGRGKGGNEQRITVQHIHINDKAQVIVGDVGRG